MRKNIRNSVSFQTLIGLVFLMVLGTVPLVSKAQAPDLLKKATKITTFKTIDVRHFNGRVYCWLSTNRALLIRRNGNLPEKLYVHDVATGKETFLPGLPYRFKKGGGLTSRLEATSNGKWVFWVNDGEDSADPDTFGASVDGLKHFRIKHSEVPVTWLPKGDRLMTLTCQDGLHAKITIYKTNGKPVTSLRFKGTGIEDYEGDMSPAYHANGNLYFNYLTYKKSDKVFEVLKYRVGTSVALEKTQKIELPDATRSDVPEFSPDGKIIAWVCESDDNKICSLWIGGTDGSKPQQVGQIANFVRDELSMFPYTVRWLPDSKHLSFIYLKTLYTVPVR